MASLQAIAVVGNTLRNLLAEGCPRDIFPGAQFRLAQGANLAGSPFTDLGVTVYLYRVDFSTTRRNLPPRIKPNGDRLKPPTPLDLHFLITAWARSAEQQWALLAWAIRTFEDSNVLPAGLLNQNAGSAPDGTSPVVFSDDEAVELVGENLSLQDMVSTWEVAKSNQQPSASFVVRSVLIDSTIVVIAGKPVQTRVLDLAPQR
jgi:hypothetical protein